MHTAPFPSGLTFGSELWNIYEKFLGHTDESFFNILFSILGFYRGLPKSLPMQDFHFYGCYHYKSTCQDVATAQLSPFKIPVSE